MSNRSIFWYGLGVGLVAGAALLELMTFSSQAGGVNGEEAAWDPAKLKEMAGQYGYQLVEGTQTLYTEQQMNEKVKQAVEAAKPTTTPAPSASSAPVSNSPAPSTVPNAASTQQPDIHIYISEGYSSTDVANLLYDAKLIKDAASFEEKLRQRRIDTKLNRGAFTFAPGSSEDDIINKILVRTP